MTPHSEITGGAGPEEMAAIAAVLTTLLEDEVTALATPPRAPRQSSWVLAWRPRDIPVPLPSHTFDARPWADIESSETDEGFVS